MVTLNRYTFRKMTPADFDLMSKWRSRPHVREWWGSDAPCSYKELEDVRVERWIVSVGHRPIGYIQDYTVHGWENHHFLALPPGSRGIDQFIGEPDMIGKGHGPAFISEHLIRLFSEGAAVVATDPHPENTRAIAAYQKVGFAAFARPCQTAWGPILPMKIERLAD